MTEERLALSELLEKTGEGDFLRAVAEAVLQLLMDADVEGVIGAGRYERSGERTTWRNGHRDRMLDTRLGSLQLRIPKATSRQLLLIQEAWIGGVSARRVDDLVQAMGFLGSAGRRSPSCARTSTSGCTPSSIVRWLAP